MRSDGSGRQYRSSPIWIGDFIELESYLKRLGLIRIGAEGRMLTGDGRRYVVEGDKMDLRDRIPIRADG